MCPWLAISCVRETAVAISSMTRLPLLNCTKRLNPRMCLLVPAPGGDRRAPSLGFSECNDSQSEVGLTMMSLSTPVCSYSQQRYDWVFVGYHMVD
jgi:hypothetical protein